APRRVEPVPMIRSASYANSDCKILRTTAYRRINRDGAGRSDKRRLSAATPRTRRTPLAFRPGSQRRLKKLGGTWLEADRPTSHRVRSTPCTAAAGSCTGPTLLVSAIPTAAAFSAPTAMIHTSSAELIAGRVRVMRLGGGFGAPRTPATGPVS